MRSGKSCFDSGVFRKSVKRFWPVWALYAFVWFIALPLGILNNSHQLPEPGSVSYYAVDAVTTTGIWLCPLAACAAAMAVFSHLYNERSANFYAALPVRRGAMFASCAAAGLLPLLAVNVIIFLLSLLLASVGGFADPPALWQYLAGSTLLIIAFFSIAAFCALLTGNAVMMPLLFAAVNVAAWALGEIAVMVPMNFSLGFRYGSVGHWADIFSPLVSLLVRLHYDYSYPAGPSGEPVCGIGGWNWLIIYAAAGIVLLLIALAFYLRRDMETAGDVVAVPPLRPVFKAAAAVLAAFLVGNLIYDLGFAEADDLGHAVIYSLCMAAGAFLGWFAAEMLLEKSFAVFRPRGFIGWAAVSVLCAAFVLGCELDVTGFERRVPDSADVVRVELSTGAEFLTFSNPADTALVTELHADCVESLEDSERGETVMNFYLGYELRDGSVLRRQYALGSNDTAFIAELDAFLNRPEIILKRNGGVDYLSPAAVYSANVDWRSEPAGGAGETLSLSAGEAAELYNECILPDMRDGNIGLAHYAVPTWEWQAGVMSCEINITVPSLELKGSSAYLSFTPTAESARTLAWLEERGVEPLTLAESEGGLYGPEV